MRNLGPPSELARLAAPLALLADGAWRRMHWWIAVMAILYAASGVTFVKSGEVAVVLRWGRLVEGLHDPGPMFAFPRPIDEVVRVDVKHVFELRITTLVNAEHTSVDRLDPVTVGYALTGDQNILHVEMVARYHLRDPSEWAFYGPKADDALRVEVTAAMVRSLGEIGIDRVLSDGRTDLVQATQHRAQLGLDAVRAGIELTSLELTRLAPPAMVSREFDAVQSAVIGATTQQKQAQEFAQRAIPRDQAEVDRVTQQARADASAARARAEGAAEAFLALDHEYRQNTAVVRERLYRDAVEKALASGSVRWVPPPVNARYDRLRISVDPGPAGPAEQRTDETPPRPGGEDEQ
jgi:membrane protease subunit HflK